MLNKCPKLHTLFATYTPSQMLHCPQSIVDMSQTAHPIYSKQTVTNSSTSSVLALKSSIWHRASVQPDGTETSLSSATGFRTQYDWITAGGCKDVRRGLTCAWLAPRVCNCSCNYPSGDWGEKKEFLLMKACCTAARDVMSDVNEGASEKTFVCEYRE